MTDDAIMKLSGEAVLRVIRDTLSNESARIRSDQERYVQTGLQTRIEPGRLAVILSLNAAVDVVTSLIAIGTDARMKAASPKGGHAAKVTLDVVRSLVSEARAALADEWGTAAKGEGDDDHVAA